MTTLILNARTVNEGKISECDLLLKDKTIERIGSNLQSVKADVILDIAGQYVFPGAIDDQVHFREPGLTHKATIHSESRAAVAGGVTSYMEMPNTIPPAFTRDLLEDKYKTASETSLANYSFYIGASGNNLDEVLAVDPSQVCGLKIFMGSSTGNLLVDNPRVLEEYFSKVPFLIATHCEDEATILRNMKEFRERYGEDLPAKFHPLIRSAEGCYASSSLAVGIAKKFNTRLHILHISTEKEISLFDNTLPIPEKRITSEACVHHLWFNDSDYERLGMMIKWNPAIKTAADQAAVFKAVLDDHIDVIATDHSPHTLEEKQNKYFNAPSGGPLVQHSMVAMCEFYHRGKISLEKIAEKMSHHPATLFRIKKRGFIREGYFADLTIIDLNKPWTVSKENILAKCNWSPFEGETFRSRVNHTFVSGFHALRNGVIYDEQTGMRMEFDIKG